MQLHSTKNQILKFIFAFLIISGNCIDSVLALSSVRYYKGIKWEEGDTERLYVVLALIALFFLFALYGYRLIIKYKKLKAAEYLEKSAREDAMWEVGNLTEHIKTTFISMQDAWMAQDMNRISDLVTANFFDHSQLLLDHQSQKGVYNFITDIRIDTVDIIGVEDYRDNKYDKFTAYINGYMVNVVISKHGADIGPDKRSYFEDLYHFVRNEDKWLLYSITNKVEIWAVSELAIKKENLSP